MGNFFKHLIMHIKSLDLIINNTKMITDIDDCLFLTSKSIRENGLSKRIFWFDDNVYNNNKKQVFSNAELTNAKITPVNYPKKIQAYTRRVNYNKRVKSCK